MNDEERRQWIDNDEGLYNWARSWCRTNKGGMRAFIREHRAEIDEVAGNVRSGERPAHYLKYDATRRPMF